MKLLKDIESHFGEFKYKVWFSHQKYKIIKPPYDLEEVAKKLGISLRDYLYISGKVFAWAEKEGIRRNLIKRFDED